MRRWFAAAAVPLALLAGCAQRAPSGGGPPPVDARGTSGTADFDRRAAEVAEAWRASDTATAWRTGFVPLEDLTVLPPNAGLSDDTKQAYLAGWFRSTARLSTESPPDGRIRFGDGEARSVALVSATDAYRAIDKGDPPCTSEGGTSEGGTSEGGGVPPAVQPERPDSKPPIKDPAVKRTAKLAQCTALTVTGVKLGTVQLRTSRGEATVPAWLFTVDELAGPLARVAVAPAAITTPPSPPLNVLELDTVTVDGDRLTYPFLTGCAEDITPLVYEAEDLVVVGAKTTPGSGVCDDVARVKRLTVTLSEPLGERMVLNAGGQPLRRAG